MTRGAGVRAPPRATRGRAWGSLEVARQVDTWLLTNVWRCGIGEPRAAFLVPSRRWLELGWRSLRVVQPK